MLRRFFAALSVFAMVMALMAPAAGAAEIDRTSVDVPDRIANLKLSAPATADSVVLSDALVGATGSQRVIVRLAAPTAKTKADKSSVAGGQAAFIDRVMAVAPNAEVLGSVQRVLNAVFLEVDAASLPALAADSAVFRINPIGNYELDLSETVPYIGGTAVHGEGFDGTGVTVAVLDSGVDYHHESLGGAGAAAYAADDQNIIEPGSFPTAKVVDGYDFVGDNWPNSPEVFDPDPLDKPTSGEGHGTHVSDIIAGVDGVAPGADLVVVKVCSSVSSSCSGLALTLGMEYAVDAGVDIINMSLGSNYGQPFDDDLSAAVDAASALGVLTVSSAGNGGDKPFIQGSPSGAATALAVAQTSVPSAVLPLMEVTAPASIAGLYPAVFQSWSGALVAPIEAPVQYGDGAGGGLNGCSTGADPNAPSGFSPFPAGSLAGKIVLVDRGACNFSTKIQNIEAGGGLIGIIGLVAPGDPFGGGFGVGVPPTIPGYMISQSNANALKAGLPDTVVRFDPAVGIPQVMSMVGSSSRGPGYQSFDIKPEIGAPGASVSAIAGSGTGTSAFGGTSGASPMVAGSAALLLQAYPGLSPAEVKARIMNNGETAIINDALIGDLAAISRIGGGEVRVDRALAAPAAAWDKDAPSGGLSLGFIDVDKETVKVKKTVVVRNYSDEDITYTITPTFRFANDEALGAVTVKAPAEIKVKAGKDKKFDVEFSIHGAALLGNYMNSGGNGANPATLTLNEIDGYLWLDDGEHAIHMPWHVLPRKAAKTKIEGAKDLKFNKDGEATLKLKNDGVGMAQIDQYSLVYVSPDVESGGRGEQSPTPDIKAVGVQTFPVPAGFCSGSDSFVWVFAVNTWERQTLAIAPGNVWIDLDTDTDGTPDWFVYSGDLSGLFSISDGRNVTWAAPYIDFDAGIIGGSSAFFFTEHSTVTGNTMLTICGEQIGMNATNFFQPVGMDVYMTDIYFGGPGDAVTGSTVAPLGERFFAVDGLVDLGHKEKTEVTFVDFGDAGLDDLGVLLVTNGDRGNGARGGATEATEALIIPAKEFKKIVKKGLK